MLMDVDEFYYADEFKKAKEFVYEKNITHSVCSIYDYRISPIYRMRDARDYCVPFIFKLTKLSKVRAISNLPCRVDSFRTFFPYIPFIHKFYYLNMVSMRHMTGIRKNYENKLQASISNYSDEGRKAVCEYRKLQYSLENMSEDEILENGYIKVKDDFRILEEWKK